MNILQVPKLQIVHHEKVSDKICLLQKEGAEAMIDQVNWEEQYPKRIPVTVKAAHDEERLFLYYEVKGEAVRAVSTDDFGAVFKDSCVEFFMQREGEGTYRNFECNILGAMLAAQHETREKGEHLTCEMPTISRHSTIHHRYEGDMQVSDWSLYLEIPRKAMGFAADELLSGQKIRANFYKCGDMTPQPHYLSWNPIHLPKPDFHVPQFFGLLELE